ncbi:helix-turn-helix domain-containing protein [Candidimonas nitroreducens]|uniref:Helix-turn-helix transcriptional regulator n=1 Tax=Candidimonas nitroreducens TaxID=683354 RepID=A0A225MCU3_9BURK|nr:helix-turn-helix domain-containing protein [Candidimonas nitroreducens]OWT59087.1 helix-turn-helix transcriptional regulator [Candidimonas nitroreducens]
MNPLTDRELDCLSWAAIGKTSWEIGAILGIAERTANFHIHNACRKLQVHGRQAAITAALQAGWLTVEPAPEKTHPPHAADTRTQQRLQGPLPGHRAAAKA